MLTYIHTMVFFFLIPYSFIPRQICSKPKIHAYEFENNEQIVFYAVWITTVCRKQELEWVWVRTSSASVF